MKYIKSLSIITVIIVIAAFFASCEKQDSSIIDPVLTFPKILGTAITPSVYDTSNVNGVAWAEVTSDEPAAKVTVTVKNPLGTQVGVYELKDDGVAPDTTAGDGRFTGRITFSLSCRLTGTYQGSFIAQNQSGLNSSNINTPFDIVNTHSQKPVVSNIISPDSLQRPVSGLTTVFLRVTAFDPDGLCDIGSVYFNTFKPNGQPSTGNPFFMYDDGDTLGHCDAVPGDGNYSLCINIAPTNDTGLYTFKYTARDRANPNLVSDTLTHTIYVYQ